MSEEKAVSRREFLKIAGIAGATIGAAGGLGGLVAACGGEATTTTAAGPTTTAAATTTSAARPPPPPRALPPPCRQAAETGREIKVGIVVPKTGALATFTIPFDWVQGQWTKILADGVVCGDGKKHLVTMTTQDTQSDTNRCAQVTGDLITNQKVDLIIAGGSPDTMNPAADQCEALETPGLFGQGPWQAFYFGRGAPGRTQSLQVGVRPLRGHGGHGSMLHGDVGPDSRPTRRSGPTTATAPTDKPGATRGDRGPVLLQAGRLHSTTETGFYQVGQ